MSKLDPAKAREAIKLSAEKAQQLVEHEAESLAERRERRRVKGVGNRRQRCEACASFVRSSASDCRACGYRVGVGR